MHSTDPEALTNACRQSYKARSIGTARKVRPSKKRDAIQHLETISRIRFSRSRAEALDRENWRERLRQREWSRFQQKRCQGYRILMHLIMLMIFVKPVFPAGRCLDEIVDSSRHRAFSIRPSVKNEIKNQLIRKNRCMRFDDG